MAELNTSAAEELERQYDSGLATRPIGRWLTIIVSVFSVAFAAYHYITAGTGVPVDYWHMGLHLSGVLLLVFINFPMRRGTRKPATKTQSLVALC